MYKSHLAGHPRWAPKDPGALLKYEPIAHRKPIHHSMDSDDLHLPPIPLGKRATLDAINMVQSHNDATTSMDLICRASIDNGRLPFVDIKPSFITGSQVDNYNVNTYPRSVYIRDEKGDVKPGNDQQMDITDDTGIIMTSADDGHMNVIAYVSANSISENEKGSHNSTVSGPSSDNQKANNAVLNQEDASIHDEPAPHGLSVDKRSSSDRKVAMDSGQEQFAINFMAGPKQLVPAKEDDFETADYTVESSDRSSVNRERPQEESITDEDVHNNSDFYLPALSPGHRNLSGSKT